jgi:uncharacterized membrane protein
VTTETKGIEDLIGYILAIGVFASLIIETLGLAGYVFENGTLEVSFSNQWQTSGSDFFAYAGRTLLSLTSGVAPLSLIALGVILLIITPYVRVVASVLYFAVEKNPKYVLISLFVFVVITLSLVVH